MEVECMAFLVTRFRREIVFGLMRLSVGSIVALVLLVLVIGVGSGRTSLLSVEC